MNIFSNFEQRIKQIAQDVVLKDLKLIGIDNVSAEPPRDPSHGDIASNVAMVLAKEAGMPPRDLAAAFVVELEKLEDVAEVSVAGPGFINLRLATVFWPTHLKEILASGRDYGRGLVANGEKINVEYVSANPTGPMHVGHCRGAVVGDALANLLQFAGYDVTKEYYVNDAGAQIDVLKDSLLLRYREALGEAIGDIPEGLYPGEYLIEPALSLAKKYKSELLEMEEGGSR